MAALVAACEPSPPPGEVSLLDVRTPQFTSDGVEACHRCHGGSFNFSLEASAHGDASNPETPYGQHGCESCHGPGSFHVSRAHGGPGVPAMVDFGFGPGVAEREEQLSACQSCHHPQAAGAAAIAFTDTAHDLPVTNCSTCHTVHVAEDPLADPRQQAETCLACHRSQRENHVAVRGKPVDFTAVPCSDCHAIHTPPGGEEEPAFDF